MRCASMMWRFRLLVFMVCAWPFCGGAQSDLFRFEGVTWKTYQANITTTKTISDLYGFDAKFVQEHKIASVAKKIESMSSDGEDGASEPDEWLVLKFDRSGRVVSAKEFLHDTIHPKSTANFVYDRFGNLTMMTYATFLFKESKTVVKYEYNNIGKLKREQTFVDDQTLASSTREFLYNTKQELIVERIAPEQYVTTLTYEYDGYGRLIKRMHLDKANALIRTDSIVFVEADVLIDGRKAQQVFYYERENSTGAFFRRTEEFVDVETGLSLMQIDSIPEGGFGKKTPAHLENFKRSFDPTKGQYEYAKTWSHSYYFDMKHLHTSGLVDRGETMTFDVSDKGEKKPVGRVEISSKEDSKLKLISERTKKTFAFQSRSAGNTAVLRLSQIETFYWSFYP